MPVKSELTQPERHTIDALELIRLERERQKEKWGIVHDDDHAEGEMAIAAACYAIEETSQFHYANELWPFASCEREPKGALENLIRAGALIVAEIERIGRKNESL